MKNTNLSGICLTEEQQVFIESALSGKNILVDACIGSGKTTAIQQLCNMLPDEKEVLYLTYNTLLKHDAQQKITNANVHVQNYHGYAYERLKECGISVAQADLLREFNRHKDIRLPQIDVLIIDEYQDIDSYSAEMLWYIKGCYPNMQIVMVGDMEQKIYNFTTLNVKKFVKKYLGQHEQLHFTICFRLSKEWALKLGKTWNKSIIGVNQSQQVCQMTFAEIVDFLCNQNAEDILCLGPRPCGPDVVLSYSKLLNALESACPEKFNKKSVYASIRDKDSNIRPTDKCAIFTTYDSSKGLERKICVLIGWTANYWVRRKDLSGQPYEILRNIFCVAASRGKEKIIILKEKGKLTWKKLRTKFRTNHITDKPLEASHLFDFTKQEYIDECYSCLNIESLNTEKERTVIEVDRKDGLIDLSPCVGIYQEAVYFKNYNIDKTIELIANLFRHIEKLDINANATLYEKILYLVSLDTGQERYRNQVDKIHFITKEQSENIVARLGERLSPDENVQVSCNIRCDKVGEIIGLVDVLKDNVVYELKFVSELSRKNYLQCALYMVGLKVPNGILWNVRTNEIYKISINDKKAFLNGITKIISDGKVKEYKGPSWTEQDKNQELEEWKKNRRSAQLTQQERAGQNLYVPKQSLSEKSWLKQRQDIISGILLGNSECSINNFAIIDIETTGNRLDDLKFETKYKDTAFSVGIVIADSNTLQPVYAKYFILMPECEENGMFKECLRIAPIEITKECSREECMQELKDAFFKYNIEDIFGYNISFDYQHLKGLEKYKWYDIASKAAYLGENPFLNKENGSYYETGRLKKGYGVESMFKLVTGDTGYRETHNAIFDAIDELVIMQKLDYKPSEYPVKKWRR